MIHWSIARGRLCHVPGIALMPPSFALDEEKKRGKEGTITVFIHSPDPDALFVLCSLLTITSHLKIHPS